LRQISPARPAAAGRQWRARSSPQAIQYHAQQQRREDQSDQLDERPETRELIRLRDGGEQNAQECAEHPATADNPSLEHDSKPRIESQKLEPPSAAEPIITPVNMASAAQPTAGQQGRNSSIGWATEIRRQRKRQKAQRTRSEIRETEWRGRSPDLERVNVALRHRVFGGSAVLRLRTTAQQRLP